VIKNIICIILFSLLFQNFSLFCMCKIDQIDDPMEYNVLTFLDTKDLGSVRLVCKKYKHWIDKFKEFLDQGEYKKNKKIKNLLKKMEKKLKNRDFIFLITKRKEILRVNKKNLKDTLFGMLDDELKASVEKRNASSVDVFFVYITMITLCFTIAILLNINLVYFPVGAILDKKFFYKSFDDYVLSKQIAKALEPKYALDSKYPFLPDRFYDQVSRDYHMRRMFEQMLCLVFNLFFCGATGLGGFLGVKKLKRCLLGKLYLYRKRRLRKIIDFLKRGDKSRGVSCDKGSC